MTDSKYPVDIVVPWVDDADPVWKKAHDSYTAYHNADNSAARFRDWDIFRYWFRAVDTYAPWVRRVHLATFGHVPQWLDLEAPKLHVVRHEEFIPGEYLPTFSSHTIELNMHRIPGLADHFIYFNDDVFLMQPTVQEDFFVNGLPADTAVLGVVKNTNVDNFMPYIMLNMLAIINMNFDKKQVIRKNWSKWLNIKYGKANLNNLYLMPWGCFTGFRNYHTCISYQKQTLETVWGKFPEILDRTCRNRFRSREDVNQYLFRYWQLASGDFVPKKPDCRYLTVGHESAEEIRRVLLQGKYRIVCVNDDPEEFDFELEKKNLMDTLEQIFPVPSSFERTDR